MVTQHQDISWINDSKGTNIEASLAALKGVAENGMGKVVLLLGGEGKGADFSELLPAVKAYCRAVIVMGKDAPLIQKALESIMTIYPAGNMQEAVSLAKACAKPNDIVLLSPACASTDQYRDYTHRGQIFMEMVKECLK
jgi:UDP-N-acetylmuramoylalanine--D-glutamate ligase